MAFPTSGLIKIFPSGTTIVSGLWALANSAQPMISQPAATLNTYFQARVPNIAVAPCLALDTEKPAASGIYVPNGGNYELQFGASTVGIEFYDGVYPSPVVATLDFIDADFPMGMAISDPQVWWNTQTLFGPGRDRDISSVLFKYFGSTVRTFAPGVGLLNGTQASGNNSIIPNPLIRWSFVQVLKSFGLDIDCDIVISALGGQPRSITSECFILAAYSVQTFQMITDNANVLPGDISTLTSPQETLDIFDIDTLQIFWDAQAGDTVDADFPGMTGGVIIPRANIFTFNSSTLQYKMPTGLGIPYGGRRLMLVGTSNSAFFVGKFALQNYNITLVDGSGLYKLTSGKRNDTYYDRSVTPPVTVNLKIPDSYVKTGFFNG